MTDTVLDLQKLVEPTEHEGDPILVDAEGTGHYFVDRDTLSPRQTAEFNARVKRINELDKKERMSEREEADYLDCQMVVCTVALPTVERSVLEALNWGQRNAILLAFLVDSGMESTMGRAMVQRARKIGAISSQASSGSTG